MYHPDENLDYFNYICDNNHIEYPDFLKECVNYVTSRENRYLSYCECVLDDAIRNVENDYCGYWNYRCLEECEGDYYDTVDDYVYNNKKEIIDYYFKLVKFFKNRTCKDITNHVFSYI